MKAVFALNARIPWGSLRQQWAPKFCMSLVADGGFVKYNKAKKKPK